MSIFVPRRMKIFLFFILCSYGILFQFETELSRIIATEFKREEKIYYKDLITEGTKIYDNDLTTELMKETNPYDKELLFIHRHTNVSSKRKTVLMMTSWFGETPWPKGLGGDTESFNTFRDRGVVTTCPIKNCDVIYDKSLFNSSDLVVFHLPDIDSIANQMLEFHKRRPPSQRWVFFTLESPYTSHNLKRFNNMFNWSATYSRESDFYSPYDYYFPLKDGEAPPQYPGTNITKTRMVAWMASNCGVQYRMQLAKALKKYGVRVDVFGICSTSFYPTDSPFYSRSRKYTKEYGWSNLSFFQEYKFYLALENRYCRGYVTEKYWNSLLHGMIPIVVGGANYSNPLEAIPGSFINALDFPSTEALAKYLLYLDRNDTAYNEYFTWREKYRIGGTFETSHNCRWCFALNNPSTPVKVYSDLENFWGRQTCKDVNSLFSS